MKLWKVCAAMAGAYLAFSQLGFAQQDSTPVQPTSPHGQVLFSGQPSPREADPAGNAAASPVTDVERRSVAVTAWNLDVHLSPRQQAMEVHAQVTLRNSGSTPLSRI